MTYNEQLIESEHIFELNNPVSADVTNTLEIGSEGTLSKRLQEYEKAIIKKNIGKE